MPTQTQATISNRILSSLSTKDYRQLQPMLSPVDLSPGDVLFTPGGAVKYVYFPNNAVVSLLFGMDGAPPVEAAMEGNEGVVGIAASLGESRACMLSVVRERGSALRLNVKDIRTQDHPHVRLQRLLNSHVSALLVHIARVGLCNRVHSIEARLARWLLMSHDRVGTPYLFATQVSIARMLGVRRSSVTSAARLLRQRRAINYSRGYIEVLDHKALVASSCSCYEFIKQHYEAFRD